ncbi:MAG: hypothetical protein NVS3B5_00650 [Sphingomicrobium sp.]
MLTAIGKNFVADDEAGFVGNEKHCRASDILDRIGEQSAAGDPNAEE